MSTPQEYIRRISLIVGDEISDGEFDFQIAWSNYAEGKAQLTRIRTMQKEIRLLKKDINATISKIRSEFISERTSVGKDSGFGSFLAGAFFGRRNIGRRNAVRRDGLRREQIDTLEPYDSVKLLIDQIIYQLDTVKGRIELSPEYQIRTPQAAPTKPPPLPLPAPLTRRFFVFIAEQVKGPYTIEQLQALHDASSITDDTPCCPEGTEAWTSYLHVMA
jgi:hypothetical protein